MSDDVLTKMIYAQSQREAWLEERATTAEMLLKRSTTRWRERCGYIYFTDRALETVDAQGEDR